MTIDWTINISAVVSGLLSGITVLFGLFAAGMRFWHAADKRIIAGEQALQSHSATLVEHSNRMEKHESRMVDVIQDVATILGQLGRDDWNGNDRRRQQSRG